MHKSRVYRVQNRFVILEFYINREVDRLVLLSLEDIADPL
jgi:hypothetical protein